MFSRIESTRRSNRSIFHPQHYGSPFNDTAEHISGLGLARLDFERCAVAGEVIYMVEGDSTPTGQQDEESRIATLAHALKKLGNREDAAEFMRCLNANCEEGDARYRQRALGLTAAEIAGANRAGAGANSGGFDGWDSIRNAAGRYEDRESVTILYFGDFDPSGENMARSLGERLAFFEVHPEIVKCALSKDDITRYKLPPDFAKKTDSRTKNFIAKNGDISVELDALPNDVLKNRLIEEVEARMDLAALEETKVAERAEQRKLVEVLSALN